MGMLDGLLGQIGANVDIENLATKIGLPADKVEEAVHALGISSAHCHRNQALWGHD